MTALRNLSVDSRKMWRIRLPSAIDERDLDTVAARHDYSEAYRRIMAQLNVLFVQEFADACYRDKVFLTEQERLIDASMDAIDSPAMDFMYRKPLKRISRLVGKYTDPMSFMNDIGRRIMSAVDLAMRNVCSKANRPAFKNSTGLSVKIAMTDFSSKVGDWVHLYVMIRELNVKNLLSENPFAGGMAGCLNFFFAKGVVDKATAIGKPMAQWIKESLADDNKKCNPHFLEGLKIGRALSDDIDLFSISEGNSQMAYSLKLANVRRFRVEICDILEKEIRETTIPEAVLGGVFALFFGTEPVSINMDKHSYIVNARVMEGILVVDQSISSVNGNPLSSNGQINEFEQNGKRLSVLRQGEMAKMHIKLCLPSNISLSRGNVVEGSVANFICYLGYSATVDALEALKSDGWDVNERASDGLSAIDWAVYNSLSRVQSFVEDLGASVDNDGDGGRGVLIRAAKARTPDRMKIVRYLAEDCCVGALTSDVCQKNGIDEEDVLNYFNSLKEA